MNFLHNILDYSSSFQINFSITQNNILICNDEDLETQKNFIRGTFGGVKKENCWDKKLIMKREYNYLLDLSKKNNCMKEIIPSEPSGKSLFVDLRISNLVPNKTSNLPPPQTITKQPSQNSNQSEDKKSPQFVIKCSI